MLVRRASRVLAIEVDADLAAELERKMRDDEVLQIVCQDALAFDPSAYFDRPYTLIANLPYYVATPLVRRFLAVTPRPTRMVVMVQREVAETMTAVQGKMGLLSVMVQLYAAAKILFAVPPRAFRPRPKVSSAVVQIDPFEQAAFHAGDPESFIEFVAGGFRAPRKQLRNSLSLGLGVASGEIDLTLAHCDIDGQRRPSTLSLSEWSCLYTAWSESSVTEC